MHKKINKAFSLIELSVVVIIIGILFAAIGSGIDLYNKSKISSARSVTRSFAGLNMPGMLLWLDALSYGSFNGLEKSPDNGDLIDSWTDVRSSQGSMTTTPFTYTSTGTARPKFIDDGIGSLPSVQFDGTSDFLQITGGVLEAGDDAYTIVVVWSSDAPTALSTIWEQNSSAVTSHKRAALLHLSNAVYGFNGQSNDYHVYTISSGQEIASIIVVNNENTTQNITIYTNNAVNSGASTSPASLDVGADISLIGKKVDDTEYLNGRVSEIMIFGRILDSDEIEIIQEYFSKKYGL